MNKRFVAVKTSISKSYKWVSSLFIIHLEFLLAGDFKEYYLCRSE